MSHSPVSSHGSVAREPEGRQDDLNMEAPPVSPSWESPAFEQDDEAPRDVRGASATPDRPRPRRPDRDASAGPGADWGLQEFDEVDPEVTFLMRRRGPDYPTHTFRGRSLSPMNHRDGGFRPDGPRQLEPRGFSVGPMPQPAPRSRAGAFQEMGAGQYRQTPLARGRMDPAGDLAMDQMFAAVQAQLQQTQQLMASMDQQRRQQEALTQRLDQQAQAQQLMGDVVRDLARTRGQDQPRSSGPEPSEPRLNQEQGRGLSLGTGRLGQVASGGDSGSSEGLSSASRQPTSSSPTSLIPVGGPAVGMAQGPLNAPRDETRAPGLTASQPNLPQNKLGRDNATAGPRPYVPKQLLPKHFDGSGNWSEFLVQFNVCAQLGQWDDFVKAQAMAGLMTGKALTTYCSLPDRDRNSFTRLVSALTLKFQERQNVARAKLESRTRQSNEKVQDLASDIWNLTCKSYPDFPMEYREQIGLEALKRALDVQLRLRLTDFKAATMDEAVNIVEQFESIMAADVQQKRRYSARAMTAQKEPATEGEMDVVMKKLDQLTQQLQQLKKPAPNGRSQTSVGGATGTRTGGPQRRSPGSTNWERKCWLCGAEGDNFHLSGDCPNGGQRSCFICGAKGPDFHLSRSCPQRPQRQGNE